jgi:hypothetical protein
MGNMWSLFEFFANLDKRAKYYVLVSIFIFWSIVYLNPGSNSLYIAMAIPCIVGSVAAMIKVYREKED